MPRAMKACTIEWAWVPTGMKPSSYDRPTSEEPGRSADQGGPNHGVGARTLGSPGAELENGPAAGRLPDPRCLGGDQGLEVEVVEQGGLDQLGKDQRPFDHGQRDRRVNHPSFGDRRDRKRLEIAVGGEPLEVVFENSGSPSPEGWEANFSISWLSNLARRSASRGKSSSRH